MLEFAQGHEFLVSLLISTTPLEISAIMPIALGEVCKCSDTHTHRIHTHTDARYGAAKKI